MGDNLRHFRWGSSTYAWHILALLLHNAHEICQMFNLCATGSPHSSMQYEPCNVGIEQCTLVFIPPFLKPRSICIKLTHGLCFIICKLYFILYTLQHTICKSPPPALAGEVVGLYFILYNLHFITCALYFIKCIPPLRGEGGLWGTTLTKIWHSRILIEMNVRGGYSSLI